MPEKITRQICLESEARTVEFGKWIAPKLKRGDVLLLEGPIGAGKTFLARTIIQSRLEEAGLVEDVPSPTFTLVQTYFDGACEIWHADLYRLSGPNEIVELGLEEAFGSEIVLVEWPDRLGSAVPETALTIKFTLQGDARLVDLSASAHRWASFILAMELAD